MVSARKTLLKILEDQPEKMMDLTILSKEMNERKVLGFGVDTLHVVYALKELGKVSYDRTRDMVYLI